VISTKRLVAFCKLVFTCIFIYGWNIREYHVKFYQSSVYVGFPIFTCVKILNSNIIRINIVER
jgi:hypothetical protein